MALVGSLTECEIVYLCCPLLFPDRVIIIILVFVPCFLVLQSSKR